MDRQTDKEQSFYRTDRQGRKKSNSKQSATFFEKENIIVAKLNLFIKIHLSKINQKGN